jgi:hypothetical protein
VDEEASPALRAAEPEMMMMIIMIMMMMIIIITEPGKTLLLH